MSADDTIYLPSVLCETQTKLPCRGPDEIRIYSVDCSVFAEDDPIVNSWFLRCNDPTMILEKVDNTDTVVSFRVSGGVSNRQTAIKLTIPLASGIIRQPVLTLTTEMQGLVSDTGKIISIGDDGMPGRSAYQTALMYGFQGTEEEWLDTFTNASVYPVTEAMWVYFLFTCGKVDPLMPGQFFNNNGIVCLSSAGSVFPDKVPVKLTVAAMNNLLDSLPFEDKNQVDTLWNNNGIMTLSKAGFGDISKYKGLTISPKAVNYFIMDLPKVVGPVIPEFVFTKIWINNSGVLTRV